jgi:hypothetical protein
MFMKSISILKKWLFLSIIISIKVSVLLAQQVPEMMYFKFNASGNQQNYASSAVGNNPATLTGISVGSTGQFGSALVGNGATSTSNNLNTGWNTNMPSTGWTISFWVNNFPATVSTTQYFFGDYTSGSQFRCFTGGVAGNNNLLVRGTGITDVPINSIGSSPCVIHIVYTGSAILVYKNATLANTVSQSSVNLTGTVPFFIGSANSTSNSIPSGTLMDEFRMYSRALTQTEITATYNQMLPVGGADAGITAITAPQDTFCSSSKTVSVRLKNFGTVAISNVKINWKVNNVAQTTYNWSGSLASNDSTLVNIGTYSFSAGTAYTVKAYTYQPNGGNDTIVTNDTATKSSFVVNPTATATITVNGQPTLCLGDSVQLSANSGTGLTYMWRYAGVDLTGETNITYYAKEHGYYNVTVNNVYNCPKTSTGQLISVDTLVTPTITVTSQTTFCTGDSVKITAPSGKTLIYQWKKNGMAISGATKSTYYAKSTGSYKVVVTKNSVCMDSSNTITITVNPRPTAKATAAGPTSVCMGDSVVMNADTGTGLIYQWKKNGAIIVGATKTSYVAKTSGSYRVVVTNKYPCADSSSAIVITVNSLPVATATPTASTTFCEGDSVRINANVSAGLVYQWRKNGVNIVKATKSYYYASVSGSYKVVVTNLNGCTDSSSAVTITVNPHPNATTIPTGSVTFCSADTLVIYAQTGTGLTYQWKKNGVDIPGSTGSSLVVKTTGLFAVVITNTSLCKETSKNIVVTLYTSPVASMVATGPTTICNGSSVVLKGNSGYGYSYQWYMDGNPINGATDTIYSAKTQGIYYYKTIMGPCSAISSTINVSVVTPYVKLGNDTTVCSDQSVVLNAGTGVNKYWWSTGDTTQTITVDSSGVGFGIKTIIVKVTLNGCEKFDTIKITFKKCAGIKQDLNSKLVRIFPNPSSGIFNLEFEDLNGLFEIRINDIAGKTVYNENISLKGAKEKRVIDLSAKAKGLYFIRLSNKSIIRTEKIVIQ